MNEKFNGLTESEVIESREKNGDNSLKKEKTKSILRRFFENLNDPIIKVLIFALIIEVIFTFGQCNFFEVGGILFAILIATTVSTVSEYGSEKAFAKMQEDGDGRTVRVVRCGEVREIGVSDLVVGDIVYLCSGERIQADGYIISGNIKVDQSALNGESRDVTKKVCKPGASFDLSDSACVFRGSLVLSGEAVMRVARVGAATYYGMVARDVQTETRISPLKLRLSKFASQISKIGYVMAAIVAFAYLFNSFVVDNNFTVTKIAASFRDVGFLVSTLIHALTLMITVVVVAAPEGLPMMITVVLSANMKKMLRDGVLVKKMVGIETAGSLNLLFTDKTGTITTGKLECDRIITADSTYKAITSLKKQTAIYEIMSLCAKYNTDAVISSGRAVGGNGTDRALATYFKDSRVASSQVVAKESFSSEKKMSSVTFSDGMTVIKGAPELIIARATLAVGDDGEVRSFVRSDIESSFLSAAREGNRVIAVAYKTKDSEALVFVSLVILKDKIRRGVRESVRGVQRAGVRVIMLTGDSKETAAAIARECGILRSDAGELVMTSSELSALDDEGVKQILPRLSVLARALPQDKVRLVRLSQELDLVVGMTGDGINDAPSLKLADVGFAMGNGQDIAKGAGDVILLDNSFFSINRTILYGRTIFKSIRKFITFQLIMNLAACGVSLVGQFIGIDSPITIIQMLWVNIIMDTLGGLAFAGEPALEYYLKEPPKSRDEPILSGSMLHHIGFTGFYTLCLCIAFLRLDFFAVIFGGAGSATFMSAFYALFIFAGIFNCFGARCERMWILSNISRNKPFATIMLLISVIQILMIYFGGTLFRTYPLTARELLSVILIAASVIPFEMVRRVFYKLRRRKKREFKA